MRWTIAERLVLVSACAAAAVPAALAGQEPGLEACPPGDPDRVQASLEGVVRDRDSDVPLPGASVTLRYREVEGQPTPEDRSARMNRQGRFRLCELETFREATVRATPMVPDEAAFLDACVRNQAKRVHAELVERSAVIGDAVQGRQVDMVSAVYDLGTGQVGRLE